MGNLDEEYGCCELVFLVLWQSILECEYVYGSCRFTWRLQDEVHLLPFESF